MKQRVANLVVTNPFLQQHVNKFDLGSQMKQRVANLAVTNPFLQ